METQAFQGQNRLVKVHRSGSELRAYLAHFVHQARDVRRRVEVFGYGCFCIDVTGQRIILLENSRLESLQVFCFGE